MVGSRNAVIVLTCLLAILLVANGASAWTMGQTIRVKMDLQDSPRELWDFHLSYSGSAFHITEEDGSSPDEHCYYQATPGSILHSDAAPTTVIPLSSLNACNEGSANDDPRTVVALPFGSHTGSCRDICSLGSTYRPRGDLYRDKGNFWVMCDSTSEGDTYIDSFDRTAGNSTGNLTGYQCINSNFVPTTVTIPETCVNGTTINGTPCDCINGTNVTSGEPCDDLNLTGEPWIPPPSPPCGPANLGAIKEGDPAPEYCLGNGVWTSDLDGADRQNVCTRGGYTATGQFCCSEYEDDITFIKESYTDIGGRGACIKGYYQPNNRFVRLLNRDYNSVLAVNGELLGCGPGPYGYENLTFNTTPTRPSATVAYNPCPPGEQMFVHTRASGADPAATPGWFCDDDPITVPASGQVRLMCEGTSGVAFLTNNRESCNIRPDKGTPGWTFPDGRPRDFAGNRVQMIEHVRCQEQKVISVEAGNYHAGAYTNTPSASVIMCISDAITLPVEGIDTNDTYASNSSRLEDWPNPAQVNSTLQPLVEPRDYCTNVQAGSNYYCSPRGLWTVASVTNLSKSVVPPPLMFHFNTTSNRTGLMGLGCCAPGTCYHPVRNSCVPSGVTGDSVVNLGGGLSYSCNAGVWTQAIGTYKTTPDGCQSGYCQTASQCLVNPNGNPAHDGNTSGSPRCINSGQYMRDDLCNNGEWTSRTKMAALKLASLVGSGDDFVISCSKPQEVLVRQQNPGLTNSYCILDLRPGRANNQRIVATTLNQELAVTSTQGNDFVFALTQSFWGAYPNSSAQFSASCGPFTRDFSECVTASVSGRDLLRLYYDDDSRLVLISDRQVSGLNPGFLSTICASLPSWLQWMCPSTPSWMVGMQNANFDRLYVARLSGKQAFGTSREKCEFIGAQETDNYVFSYNGYSNIDVAKLFSTVQASRVSITGGPGNASVSIQDPSGDRLMLWNSLGFLRG